MFDQIQALLTICNELLLLRVWYLNKECQGLKSAFLSSTYDGRYHYCDDDYWEDWDHCCNEALLKWLLSVCLGICHIHTCKDPVVLSNHSIPVDNDKEHILLDFIRYIRLWSIGFKSLKVNVTLKFLNASRVQLAESTAKQALSYRHRCLLNLDLISSIELTKFHNLIVLNCQEGLWERVTWVI